MFQDKKYLLFCGNKRIGYFTIVNDNPSISLLKNLPECKIPWDFRMDYANGVTEFSSSIVKRWIADRVTPSGRHNIEEILRHAGLSEYNPLGLFLYTSGRYTQDNFYIKE